MYNIYCLLIYILKAAFIDETIAPVPNDLNQHTMSLNIYTKKINGYLWLFK